VILLVASLSVPGASFAVLSIMVAVAGTAAIVLTIRAILPTVFSTVLTTIFAAVFATILSAVLTSVLAAIFTARGFIGLASHCGGREQGAGDEQCCPQM